MRTDGRRDGVHGKNEQSAVHQHADVDGKQRPGGADRHTRVVGQPLFILPHAEDEHG